MDDHCSGLLTIDHDVFLFRVRQALLLASSGRRLEGRPECTEIEFDRMSSPRLIGLPRCRQNAVPQAIECQEIVAFLPAIGRPLTVKECDRQEKQNLVQAVMPDETNETARLVIGTGRIGEGKGHRLVTLLLLFSRAMTALSTQRFTAGTKSPELRTPFW